MCGVQLFRFVDGTSHHASLVNGLRAILDGLRLESVDPVLVMLLVSGLVVATLAMGGLILWNRKTR